MFNAKEKLEQIRRNKTAKEETSSFLAENNNPVPLFQESKPAADPAHDMMARLARLENTVNELSGQLRSSNDLVSNLKRENSELETKLLKLEYENSQLKVSSRVSPSESRGFHSNTKFQSHNAENIEVKRTDSHSMSEVSDVYSPEVEEALEQIRKEPLENILKRKEHNFRALKTDQKQAASGNKHLKEFANICKDYGKTLKKPVLVLKLQANDFE